MKHGNNIDPLYPSSGATERAKYTILICIAYKALGAILLRETFDDLLHPMTKGNYPYYKAFVLGWKEKVGTNPLLFGKKRSSAGKIEDKKEETQRWKKLFRF